MAAITSAIFFRSRARCWCRYMQSEAAYVWKYLIQAFIIADSTMYFLARKKNIWMKNVALFGFQYSKHVWKGMFGLGFNKHRTTQLNAQIFPLKCWYLFMPSMAFFQLKVNCILSKLPSNSLLDMAHIQRRAMSRPTIPIPFVLLSFRMSLVWVWQ